MKQKITLTSLFLFGFGLTGLQAQETISATGGSATGSGGTASYSVGQVVYKSITGANGSVNQGVQQPYEVSILGIDNIKEISLVCSVYPNPAQTSINLKVDKLNPETLSFLLFDINGKLILTQKINSNETSIPMEDLARATYILKIIDNNKEIKSFQIIKNN